jgi:hypothetical protein
MNDKREDTPIESTRTPDPADVPGTASDPLSRRSFVGVGVSTAVAAAAGVGLPALLRAQAPDMDWNTIAKFSQRAFEYAVNEWISRARVQGGTVNGAAATLTPGSLVSDVNLETRMGEILSSWQAPQASMTIARVLAAAWNEWAAGYQLHVPGAYPKFMAVPAPHAPPTRAAVSPPLSQGSSAGEVSLHAPALANRLVATLRMSPMAAAGPPEPAMQNLATWVENSFNQWKGSVTVTGLIGKGPVPVYAPPYVYTAPVVGGSNTSAASVLAGPRFGIVTP